MRLHPPFGQGVEFALKVVRDQRLQVFAFWSDRSCLLSRVNEATDTSSAVTPLYDVNRAPAVPAPPPDALALCPRRTDADRQDMPSMTGSHLTRPKVRFLRGAAARAARCALPVLVVCLTGCGLRALPPVRYVPVLGATPKVSTPAVLLRALHDPEVGVRAQAVKLLGELAQRPAAGDRREVAAALGFAARDRDPGIRLMAIERLGAMEERYANRYLLGALADPDGFVRERVMAVLASRQARAAAPPPPPPVAATDSTAAAP